MTWATREEAHFRIGGSMAILQHASVQDRKRLLELFPLAVFREVRRDLKGTKDEVCYSVAEQSTPDQIVAFINGA